MRKKYLLSLVMVFVLISSIAVPAPARNINKDYDGIISTTLKIDDPAALRQWLEIEGLCLGDISDIHYITVTDVIITPQKWQYVNFQPFVSQDIRLVNIRTNTFTDYNWTLRNSIFPAPGGKMDISTSINTDIGSFGMSTPFISAQLGASISNSVTITESFSTPIVPANRYGHVIVHPKFQSWNYDIVRFVGDNQTNLGSGYTTQFMGVRFIVIVRQHA